MAVRWAVASGNWSSTATWNGGTLPAADDDVFADGWSVTINQNVTVLSLNTTQRSGGTAGGSFTVSANGIVVNCSTINAGTSSCLLYSGVSPNSATINCATINGSATTALVHGVLNSSSNGTLNINSTTINAGRDVATAANGVRCTNATMNIVCVLAVGGNNSFCTAVALTGTGAINFTGTVRGGTFSTARGLAVSAVGTVSVVVNGSIEGGSGSGAEGCVLGTPTNLTVNGNVVGGGASGAVAVVNSSTGSIMVSGNAIGGTNSTAYGISNTSTGTVTLNGIAIASNTTEAVNNTSTGIFTVLRAQHAANGRTPWTGNGKIFFGPLGTTNLTINNSSGTQRMLGRVGG